MFHQFSETRKKNIEKLNAIQQLINPKKVGKLEKYIDFINIRRDIEADIKALEDNELRIIVCGAFGSGKTTFINTLLGMNALPTATGENSSTVVYLKRLENGKYDGDSEVRISLLNSRSISLKHEESERYLKYFLEKQHEIAPELDDKEWDKLEAAIVFNELLTDEEIGEIREYGYSPSKHVYNVTVYLDNPILNKGVTFVDSPGTGSISKHHEEQALAEIKRSHAFVYLFNSGVYGTQSDFNFVRQFWMYKEKTLLLLNKADLIYTDQAVEKDIDTLIFEFKSKFPNDIDCSGIEIYPLSIALKKDFDKSNLNSLYRKRLENGEETRGSLSNYDIAIKRIEELAERAKGSIGQERGGLDTNPNKYLKLLIKKLESGKSNFEIHSDLNIDKMLESLNDRIERSDDKIRAFDDISTDIIEEYFNTMMTMGLDNIIGSFSQKITNEVENIESMSFDELFESGKPKSIKPISVIKTEAEKTNKEIKVEIFQGAVNFILNQVDFEDQNVQNEVNLSLRDQLERFSRIELDASDIVERTRLLDDNIRQLRNILREENINLSEADEEVLSKSKKFDHEIKQLVEKRAVLTREIENEEKLIDKLGDRPDVKYEPIEESESHWFGGYKKTTKKTQENTSDQDRWIKQRDSNLANIRDFKDKINKLNSEIENIESKKNNLNSEIEAIKKRIRRKENEKDGLTEDMNGLYGDKEQKKNQLVALYREDIDNLENRVTDTQLYKKLFKEQVKNICVFQVDLLNDKKRGYERELNNLNKIIHSSEKEKKEFSEAINHVISELNSISYEKMAL